MPDFLEGRQRLVTSLREELVGPSPRGTAIDGAGDISFPDPEAAYGPWKQTGSGEEILHRDRPIKRYGVGVLYPPETQGEADPGKSGSEESSDELPPEEEEEARARKIRRQYQ